MVIGATSTSYLVTWAGLQLGGIQGALVNPTYPDTLLREMGSDLRPDGVVWIGREAVPDVAAGIPHFEMGDLNTERMTVAGKVTPIPHGGSDAPGLAAAADDISSYMHTSGTTGPPKFCAQSHHYLLKLGRFIADSASYTEADTVYAPLPMFHINPLGYGVIAALLAGANVLGSNRFSARGFWRDVVEDEVTAAVLHVPPVNILKKATGAEDAKGHRLRVVVAGDPDFLNQFDIPQGLTGYGSTEAAGLTHTWKWRRGDFAAPTEGPSHLAGLARYDVECRLADDGEILVRDKAGPSIFSGYRKAGTLQPPDLENGWFHTGDLGRLDEWGNLIFVERMAESIRVKGEYVPIEFVEEHLGEVAGIGDFAIWRRSGDLMADQAVVLYLTGDVIPVEGIRQVIGDLPVFMRPVAAIRVAGLPRDSGVGKVQRQRLGDEPVLEAVEL